MNLPILTELLKEIDVENQHKHIKGYRDLSAQEIALMNEAKELAEKVGELVTKLGTSDVVPTTEGIDQRWLAVAKTDLQKGFMSLIRSIAQPTTF
jgi:hypothetical protein